MRWGSSLYDSERDAYDACAEDFLSASGGQPMESVLLPTWPGGWSGLDGLVEELIGVWGPPCECSMGCEDCRDGDSSVWTKEQRRELSRAISRVLCLDPNGEPTWRPTHRIVSPSTGGGYVMLTDTGAAYTLEEWRNESTADYAVENGEWLFQGEAFNCEIEDMR